MISDIARDEVLGTPSFMARVLTSGLAFAPLSPIYVSVSSFVLHSVLGFTALGCPVTFAVNAAVAIVAALVSTRPEDRIEPGSILKVAVTTASVVNLAVLGPVLAGMTALPTLVPLSRRERQFRPYA